MAKINEIKEQRVVVASVGQFANSLQQIATMRMTQLRKLVLASRPFVDESVEILKELKTEKRLQLIKQLKKVDKKFKIPSVKKEAIIIISSYSGLCGSYNTEIFKKIEKVFPEHPYSDYFVIGSKGQDYFKRIIKKNPDTNYYPYNIPENVEIEHLKKLISIFAYYDEIYLIYSKYINTAKRDVVLLELSKSVIEEEIDKEAEKQAEKERQEKKEKENQNDEGKFIFEPNLDQLIENISDKLRYSLFKQQILDSKLSLYAAQMVAMQTAADNAKDLLAQLQHEYNKARRKLIDAKIQEVQAGRALWAD